jgi:hypothetical protein
MKKSILLFIGILVAAVSVSQTKLTPIKKNGKYMAPVVFPLTSEVEIDSTNFWRPPSIPIPTDDTTRIDGRNGTFVGTGWGHPIAAGNGWSANTLSFSNIAGNTVTYKFQGTKVELWGEKKTTHGTGVVTVRLGANVIDTKTVSFIGTTQLPALIYTSPNLTANSNYTIELKVTSGWNLVDFLVIWNYAQSTGSIDPDPVDPPAPGEILIQPGQNIQNIINGLSRGKVARLAPGNHTIGKVTIPDGVTVRGSGKANTFLWPVAGIWPSNNEDAMLILKGGTGGQIISDLTIKGNNTATGGIYNSRNNVSLENVRVENCKFFGTWSTSNSGFKTYELDLINNSWSSAAWCSGELVFGGVLSNFDVELGLIQTTNTQKGYAIKILWNSATNALNNGKIHGGRIDLNHYSNWGNGLSRNISIEIHDCTVNGYLDIYDMVIENQVSLALHRENTGWVNVYRCVFNLEGDTYTLEHVLNNLNFYDSQIFQAGMILANFRSNMRCKNAKINNIVFSSPVGSAMYGGVIYTGELGVENVLITNSKIDVLRNMALIRHRRDGSTCTGTPTCQGVTIGASNTIKYL